MQQLRRNSVSRIVAYILMVAMFTPQGLMYLPSAFAQAPQNVPAVAVVPFQDLTNRATPALMREVTAAAALALEDRKEYIVTSTVDLEREMQALRMKPPLSTPEQVRLGQRLHVEKVLVGNLVDLRVDSGNGQARVVLHLQLLDVGIGEYLDGAAVSIQTKPIPGFSGDVSQVTHEALRQAAEAGVEQMLSATVRRGTVEMVDDQGNVNINLGTDDGIANGDDLLVMRPTWQPDVEQVIMRRIGTIRIAEAEAGMATARTVQGAVPTTGDRIYRIYKPVSAMAEQERSKKVKRGSQMLAALLLLVGVAAMGTGSTSASPSQVSCYMNQESPGAVPTIELRIHTGSTAGARTHGFVVYRGTNNRNFLTSATNMIAVTDDPSFSVFSDEALTTEYADSEFEFDYRDEEGEIDQGTVTYAYVDFPLVAGSRYYYRVRRIIDPLQPPGTNPPIGTTQVEDLPEPNLEVDPSNAISEASAACGPVTFFVPPVLGSTPAANSTSVTTENITFTWQSTVGANEYQVEVFPESDPDGTSEPLFRTSIVRTTGTTSTPLSVVLRGPLSSETTYWWRVGARQSSDAHKPVYNGKSAFLYSEMRKFTTALTPPPTPTSAGIRNTTIPTRHGGWTGAGRSGRR